MQALVQSLHPFGLSQAVEPQRIMYGVASCVHLNVHDFLFECLSCSSASHGTISETVLNFRSRMHQLGDIEAF